MENKIYANTDNNTEFKTRLKVGEVVIVEYDDYKILVEAMKLKEKLQQVQQ